MENKKNEGEHKQDEAKIKRRLYILYYPNGNKLYEGELKNGNFEGRGIYYDENGNKRYEGEFKDNNYEGRGIYFDENGNKRYVGEFKNNYYEG